MVASSEPSKESHFQAWIPSQMLHYSSLMDQQHPFISMFSQDTQRVTLMEIISQIRVSTGGETTLKPLC
jgi:hypothetical protein